MALWILSGKTQVSWYQKKHSPTHTHRGHQISLSALSIHDPWHPPYSIHVLYIFFSTISLQVFFGLPLGLAPSTSYSIHFFTQSLSSFRSTCPYHRNLFCCSTEIMSSDGVPKYGSEMKFGDKNELTKVITRDYFDATASNWNTSAHSAPWRVSLYKDWQSNRRVSVF